MAKRDQKSWANLDPYSPEFAAAALDRFEEAQSYLKESRRHDRIKRMWSIVFMRDKDGGADTSMITSGGRRGETMFIQPNRLARLVRDHISLVVQTKSLPEPMAANSDAESQDQVALAKGIIEHYRRTADLEGLKADRAFVAEICGDSYLHAQWDADAGNEIAVADVEPQDVVESDEGEQPATQRIVYDGDFRFTVRTPYDVAQERNPADKKKPRWAVVAEPVNRYDMIAQIREEVSDDVQRKKLERAIMDAPAWSDRLKELDFQADQDKHDDCIALYFVYVDRSRSTPNGRYAKVIDKHTVWFDSPAVESRIPLFRLSQGEVLFRNEATTPNHDGLPLADAMGAQLSTILSNHANYGMQRLLAARKSNLSQTELDSGAATVNYDHVDEAGQPIPPPHPWQMGGGNAELFTFYELLASELDLVAQGSPVTRGDAAATRGDSGSKVAALFAAAQNVSSSFVAEVMRSEEELYTHIVDSLKRHATTARVVSIVGENNTLQAKEYTADKLSKILRVKVGQADAMRDTLQGKVAMVELLDGKTPQQQRQVIAVLRTGLPEVVTDETEPARILLERENQDLRDPSAPMPVCMPNDDHAEHWRSHMNELNSPAVRRDESTYSRIIKHALEHEAKLDPANPKFAGHPALLLTGQKPLPVMEQPGRPNPPAKMRPDDGDGDEAMPQQQQQHKPQGGMPEQPQMPVNPTSGERMSTGGVGQPSRPQASPTMG